MKLFSTYGNLRLTLLSFQYKTINSLASKTRSLEQYIIQRCRSGDRKAQEELYQLYVGAMYNICRRMMGDEEAARDVLQDAFVHAFSKLNTIQDDKYFAAWIKRVVVNHCINELRKRKMMTEPLEDNTDFAVEDEGDYEYEKQNKVKDVLRAMDQVSEGCRTIMNLYVFEGYDHKEIAQILSITESTSKAQYSKAKSKIREILRA